MNNKPLEKQKLLDYLFERAKMEFDKALHSTGESAIEHNAIAHELAHLFSDVVNGLFDLEEDE